MTKQEKRNNRIFIIFWIAICIPLFTWIWFNGQKREEELKNNSYNTVAIIEHLKPHQRKGTTTNKDVVYLYFQYDNQIIHEIESIPAGAIESLEIKEGDQYPITVSKSDPNIFDISFKQKIDSFIELDTDLKHVYQSRRHRENLK